MMKTIARILLRKPPVPLPDIGVDPRAEPKDLDDPFLDEVAQKRVGLRVIQVFGLGARVNPDAVS